MTGYDAVLLAGGGAARLGGVVKPALQVGGVTLLDRVLAAVPGVVSVQPAGSSSDTSGSDRVRSGPRPTPSRPS